MDGPADPNVRSSGHQKTEQYHMLSSVVGVLTASGHRCANGHLQAIKLATKLYVAGFSVPGKQRNDYGQSQSDDSGLEAAG